MKVRLGALTGGLASLLPVSETALILVMQPSDPSVCVGNFLNLYLGYPVRQRVGKCLSLHIAQSVALFFGLYLCKVVIQRVILFLKCVFKSFGHHICLAATSPSVLAIVLVSTLC